MVVGGVGVGVGVGFGVGVGVGVGFGVGVGVGFGVGVGVGVGVGDGVGVLNSSSKSPGFCEVSRDCGACEPPNALMPTMIIAMMTSAIERIKNALG